MKKTATVLAVLLAMMATSFAQGPKQQGGHRPPPSPQEEKAKPEQKDGEKATRKKTRQEARGKARAEREAKKRDRESQSVPPRKPRPPVIKEPAASANIIMPFNPVIEPVVVPSQRFVVPKYS